jgi:hypothetical protein
MTYWLGSGCPGASKLAAAGGNWTTWVSLGRALRVAIDHKDAASYDGFAGVTKYGQTPCVGRAHIINCLSRHTQGRPLS